MIHVRSLTCLRSTFKAHNFATAAYSSAISSAHPPVLRITSRLNPFQPALFLQPSTAIPSARHTTTGQTSALQKQYTSNTAFQSTQPPRSTPGLSNSQRSWSTQSNVGPVTQPPRSTPTPSNLGTWSTQSNVGPVALRCRPIAVHAVQGLPSRPMATSAHAPKAALLVIGNEILNGSIQDTNTPWLAKLLYSQGVDLVRVEYIPDVRDDIIATVLRVRERVGPDGFVFTSGGIGPTHDDITYEAIAAAAGIPLEVHGPTVERMKEYYASKGTELNDARLRMATLPAGAEVLYTPELWVPLVNINSIYILPGIPRLFQAMLTAHKDRFRSASIQHKVDVYSTVPEGDLAAPLTDIANQFPSVLIGSYPNCDPADERFKVKLTLECRDEAALEGAVKALQDTVPTFTL